MPALSGCVRLESCGEFTAGNQQNRSLGGSGEVECGEQCAYNLAFGVLIQYVIHNVWCMAYKEGRGYDVVSNQVLLQSFF